MASKPRFSGERVSFSDAFEEISKGVAKYKQADYLETGIYPIVDQGRFAIAGYTNAAEGVCSNVPAIVFGDHTRIVKYVDTPFCAGADGVKILKPRLSSNVRFWYHALRSAKIDSLGYSRHFKLLKGLSFVCPQESEQDCICQKLDSVLDLIFLQEAEISWLNDLVKSRFIEMFGDPRSSNNKYRTVPGSKLFKIGNGKSRPTESRFDHGVPAYGGNGISWYTDKSLTDGPTIIIGRVGRHCGNVRLVRGQCWVTDNAMYVRKFLYNDIDYEYLIRLMDLVDFNQFADKGDLWKITQAPFLEFEYLVPPLSLQREFAGFAREVDKLEFATRQSIEKLQMLYDSLAQEYFSIEEE